MAPVVAASLFSGGAGILGGIMQNNANKQLQADANAANAAIAHENRQWQEMMANTAHQREVKDLRAAGLNPILSATGGAGAATPSGSTSSVQAAKMEDVLGKGVSSALASRQLEADLEAKESQISLNKSAEATQATQQVQNITSAKKAEADTLATIEATKGQKIQNKVAAVQAPTAAARAEAEKATAEWDKSAAGFDAIVNRGLNLLGGASSALGNIFRGRPSNETKTLRQENKTMKNYINSGRNRR